ncbi:MAG: acyl-CoA dehydrogenase family protein [Ilumatobacteraceae bacterium]
MTDRQVDDLVEFRQRVRSFFDALPGLLNERCGPLEADDGSRGLNRARTWRAALYDAGLAGFGYPVEAGGLGERPEKAAIYAQESRGRVPSIDAVFGIGIGMALPVIRDHCAPALRQRFLRPGLRGDEIWCQLYSEPNAGSDLASLATRAERDGDEWVVTGQKVWTSGAEHADLAILLARTDAGLPKHRGITMLVLPMRQPGVTVRPLRQMTGVSEFNEVFIDEARLPADWIVGDLNDGWRMGTALLAHERVATGTNSVLGSREEKRKTGRNPLPAVQLIELARQCSRAADPEVRQRLATAFTGEQLMRWLGTRRVHPSIGKLWRTKQGRFAADLAAALQFPAGVAWDGDDVDADYWQYHLLNCRGMSLGGGTDEIQRNTLGERVLGLPKEPAIDADVPYRELLRNGRDRG